MFLPVSYVDLSEMCVVLNHIRCWEMWEMLRGWTFKCVGQGWNHGRQVGRLLHSQHILHSLRGLCAHLTRPCKSTLFLPVSYDDLSEFSCSDQFMLFGNVGNIGGLDSLVGWAGVEPRQTSSLSNRQPAHLPQLTGPVHTSHSALHIHMFLPVSYDDLSEFCVVVIHLRC
jgi:hypothetical protein